VIQFPEAEKSGWYLLSCTIMFELHSNVGLGACMDMHCPQGC
jgi:hypothetical protein